MCKTGWRAQVKINAKGQSLRFMKMLTFFRYYAKRTTGKCFKNAIFQHDAGKAYWVIGLEFTSRWWIVCNILYIGHRNIWEFRAWKMYFLFFFVYRKVCLCTRRVRCCFLHNKIVNIHAWTQSVFFIVAIMNTHNLHVTD